MKMVIVIIALVFLSGIAVQAQEAKGETPAKGNDKDYSMEQDMMGGNYGVVPGMIGGFYGMGYGMGPGYYGHSPECQEFYNKTVKLRKEFYDKKFEYFETLRDPKALGETAARLYKEVKELHDKIYRQAPLGCRW